MTTTVEVTNTAATASLVVEVFELGTGGQPDSLVSSGLLAPAAIATVGITATQYMKAHEASEDEVKSIDNWRA